MNLLPSALPWKGLVAFPLLLVFIGVLLFSTATLAFYLKQTISFKAQRDPTRGFPVEALVANTQTTAY